MLGWSTVVQLCLDEGLVLSVCPGGVNRLEVLVTTVTGELVYRSHMLADLNVAIRVHAGIQQVLQESEIKEAA